jgi:hypothetical protein
MKTPISDAAVYEVLGTDKVVDYNVCRDLEQKLEKAKIILRCAKYILEQLDYNKDFDAGDNRGLSFFSGDILQDTFFITKDDIDEFLS